MTSSSRNIELDVDLDIFRQDWHEELINKQTAEAIEANLQSSSSRQTSKVDGRSSSNPQLPAIKPLKAYLTSISQVSPMVVHARLEKVFHPLETNPNPRNL
jgi:hypothetical protein